MQGIKSIVYSRRPNEMVLLQATQRGRNALANPMVQTSINIPINILVIKPIKIITWDLAKIPKMST
jgi:hypothetical protein